MAVNMDSKTSYKLLSRAERLGKRGCGLHRACLEDAGAVPRLRNSAPDSSPASPWPVRGMVPAASKGHLSKSRVPGTAFPNNILLLLW